MIVACTYASCKWSWNNETRVKIFHNGIQICMKKLYNKHMLSTFWGCLNKNVSMINEFLTRNSLAWSRLGSKTTMLIKQYVHRIQMKKCTVLSRTQFRSQKILCHSSNFLPWPYSCGFVNIQKIIAIHRLLNPSPHSKWNAIIRYDWDTRTKDSRTSSTSVLHEIGHYICHNSVITAVVGLKVN